MQRFAFIIHPLEAKRDVARKYPIARLFPERAIEWYLANAEPQIVCKVTGLRSMTGVEAEGWLILCPMTPRQLLSFPLEKVWEKLTRCGEIAQDLGAGIVGLGAFTSVVGDGGITLSKRLRSAVTTGNSYTVATAIEGAVEAGHQMGINPAEATVAVVGATGSIGATCAEMLARQVRAMNLVGRDTGRLDDLKRRLGSLATAKLTVTTDIAAGLRDADIVITVSSAAKAIVRPEHIKSGAVVCDVARPRDVSVEVAKRRKDVLVIEGGVVQLPGDVHFPFERKPGEFDFSFPPGTSYACMAETMALALDDRYESFTLGKEVTVRQVEEINHICRRHGFRLAGFRSFEKAITQQEIERIRKNAGRPEPIGI